MNGKDENYTLILSTEGGTPQPFFTRTDEDLIEKFRQCRENKFSYFVWNNGCVPMRNLLGVIKSS